MSFELKMTSLLFIVFINFIILYLVSKNKISIKYSFIWFIPSFILLIFIIAPNILNKITSFLGFQTASNMIFAILIAFLIIICIALTVIVSNQKKIIRILIQEVSILKNKKVINGNNIKSYIVKRR